MTTSKSNSAKSTNMRNRVSSNKASKKAAAKKAVAVKKAARQFVSKTLFIVKLVKTNPRKEGSIGHHSFGLIKNGMTVEQFQEKGGRLKDMHWDVRHNHLKLQPNKPKAA